MTNVVLSLEWLDLIKSNYSCVGDQFLSRIPACSHVAHFFRALFPKTPKPNTKLWQKIVQIISSPLFEPMQWYWHRILVITLIVYEIT